MDAKWRRIEQAAWSNSLDVLVIQNRTSLGVCGRAVPPHIYMLGWDESPGLRIRLLRLTDPFEAQVPHAVLAGAERSDLAGRITDEMNRVTRGCFEGVAEGGPQRHRRI